MTLLFQHEPPTHTPIVCDFTDATDTPEERLTEYAQLLTNGPTQAQPVLDEYYELYRTAATTSVDDLIAGLAARGLTVTRLSDDRFQYKPPHDHRARGNTSLSPRLGGGD